MALSHGLANLDSTERELIVNNSSPALFIDQQGTGKTLRLRGAATAQPVNEVLANSGAAPSVAVTRFGSSVASQAAMEFIGSCVQSTASGGVSLIAKVRVKFGDVYGWLPVYETLA